MVNKDDTLHHAPARRIPQYPVRRNIFFNSGTNILPTSGETQIGRLLLPPLSPRHCVDNDLDHQRSFYSSSSSQRGRTHMTTLVEVLDLVLDLLGEYNEDEEGEEDSNKNKQK